jgi:hypothetical protein
MMAMARTKGLGFKSAGGRGGAGGIGCDMGGFKSRHVHVYEMVQLSAFSQAGNSSSK